jgi:hypothetical protein
MTKEIRKSPAKRGAAAKVPSSRVPQAKPQSSTLGSSPVAPELRQIMICEAAYYIAEHRGFEPGHDVADWLAAEQQVDAALTSPASWGAESRP